MTPGKRAGPLILVASALLMSSFTACGRDIGRPGASGPDMTTPVGTPTTQPTPVIDPVPPRHVPMPQTGTYIGDLSSRDGKPPMMLAVSVDRDRVVAYATNGTNDEAWFFGTQRDGLIQVNSKYRDFVDASFDGTQLNSNVVTRGADAGNYFSSQGPALAAAPPAGIYTATLGDARATWIVGPDQRVVGVLTPNFRRDDAVIDQIYPPQDPRPHPQDPEERDSRARQARLGRVIQPAPPLTYGTWTANINGTTVIAVAVTGDMTSPPNTA
jgi:hypothetical protein